MDPDFMDYCSPVFTTEFAAAEKLIRDAGATSFEDGDGGITIVVPASQEASVFQAIEKIKAGAVGPDMITYFSEFTLALWNEEYQDPDDPQMPTKK